MKFSYNLLKKYVRITQTPKELAELLTMRAFEVESMEKIGDDAVFDIALPPNRVPDAGGHIGMAREIAALTERSFKLPAVKVREYKKLKTKNFLSISVEDSDACTRYLGRVIRNIAIKDSPRWLQEFLLACGLCPINNIVDAANFVMLETGQPLHVFDLDKLAGGKIIVRRAKNGEKMTTLDRQDLLLTSDDLVIADAKSPVALAGIKGGDKAEVNLKTLHIVLEAANFLGAVVRQTSRRIGIRNDSSYRFEHNLHPELAAYAMERLAALIRELAGGEVLSSAIDSYPQKAKAYDVLVDPARVSSMAGVAISFKDTEKLLKRMSMKYAKKKSGFLVQPPKFRRDLTIQEDFIEELIRMYGYEHIPEVFPATFIPAQKNDEQEWFRFIRQILRGAGFSEIYRYAFIGEREIKLLGQKSEEYIELQNPISPEFKYLVREPYENLVSWARSNIERENLLHGFSIDKGFLKLRQTGGNGSGEYGEEKYLTIVMCDAETKRKENKEDQENLLERFFAIKGVVTGLLDAMGIDDAWFDNSPEYRMEYPKLLAFNHLHPYRRAEIKIGDETIGVVGELHPTIAENWKLDRKFYVCELLAAALLRLATSEIEFREIPKFPAILRDLAVLVPEEVRIEEVQELIENTGGMLLEDVDFFDEYIGQELPDGKRSLAFRLVFRDARKTLEEKEVADAMKKIQAALAERGWEIR